ncbi:HAD-IIIA family hydrolase [Deltaproteobacteria bacterium TL4]
MKTQTFKRVVFLDRDGVINQEQSYITSAENFSLIPQSAEAIRLINQQNWLCIVITNQSAFARGLMSQHSFDQICKKMEEDLAQYEAKIDDLFYCPHHPQWKPGWVKELCHPCECRKPGVQLFEQAAKKYDFFNRQAAVFIGDTTSDFEAASRWQMPSIGLETGHAGKDGKYDRSPTLWAKNLYAAVELLLRQWPALPNLKP